LIKAGKIKAVNSFEEAFSFGDRTRTFLKVQDGCNYKCTFCTIPLARGASRSNTIEHVIESARNIAKQGAKEVVLTGVNIGDFGNGTEVIEGIRPQKEALFLDLIKALDRISGIERFRISSIEPNLCTNNIISFVADSKRFVPHFHMPLQSGSNDILKLMRRRYRRELYREKVDLIKKSMPHACIGVDVIVGFTGESDAHFAETFDFISDLDVSYLHVFTYSERPNTAAFSMSGKVPMNVRRKRNDQLRNLSEKKRIQFYNQHLSTIRYVLFEESKTPGELTGFTDNYIKICLKDSSSDLINHIRQVRLEQLDHNGHAVASLVSGKPNLQSSYS
jgi:threonylcarbamoyladenosine tRNA methylthiotransferase MtaB